MMFYVAKFIQAVGFADVGYSLFIGVTQDNSMGRELRLMMVGVAIFLFGRLVEQRLSA